MTARLDQFSAFIRDLAIRQARVLANAPPYFDEVECPSCGEPFLIPGTGGDVRCDCPTAAPPRRSYDASQEPGRLWQGGYALAPDSTRPDGGAQ